MDGGSPRSDVVLARPDRSGCVGAETIVAAPGIEATTGDEMASFERMRNLLR